MHKTQFLLFSNLNNVNKDKKKFTTRFTRIEHPIPKYITKMQHRARPCVMCNDEYYYITNLQIRLTQVQMSNLHQTDNESTISETLLVLQMTIYKWFNTMYEDSITELKINISSFTFITKRIKYL